MRVRPPSLREPRRARPAAHRRSQIFSVSTAGWTAAADELPLSYAVSYTVAGDPSGASTTVRDFATAASASTVLPAGTAAGNYTLSVSVAAQNAYGVVAVSPPATVTVTWPVVNASQSAALVTGFTASAASAAASGDTNSALQLLGGVTAFLNQSTPASGNGSSADAGNSVQSDLTNFMHALFQSMQSASQSASTATAATTGTAGTTASSGASGNTFASGLSQVISEVSNGSAPSALQTAFNTLSTALQQLQGSAGTGSGSASSLVASASGASAAGAANPGTGNSTQITLQQLLTQLQQTLGYNASLGNSALGSYLNTSA